MNSPISSKLVDLNVPHLDYKDVQSLIACLESCEAVSINTVGNSFEGREIYQLTLGHGPTVILAWTQMHGDEATATAAVFDLLDDILQEQSLSLLEFESQFTLHIVPMLNPDGAQRCTRHNAQGIDINRDAIALQTPEGQILEGLANQIKPNVAFNLHDQSPYYQAGKSGQPSTIAFLAPAFNESRDIDESRELAMAIIGKMTEDILPNIPNCVARYNDTFSHRSFGDCIAQKGISTILIEAGAAKNDPNRQIARKMTNLAMQSALNLLSSIEKGTASKQSLDNYKKQYWQIPENIEHAISSLLIKNLHFIGTHSYQASISIKQSARYSNQFFIEAVGDLGIQAGLNEMDATDLTYEPGMVHTVNTPTIITNASYRQWLKKGVIAFQGEPSLINNQSDFPILLNQALAANPNALALDQPAYFLMQKGLQVVAAVINGQLLNLIESS